MAKSFHKTRARLASIEAKHQRNVEVKIETERFWLLSHIADETADVESPIAAKFREALKSAAPIDMSKVVV